MRVLHISDLHYGAHNEALASSLEHFVKTLQPDVILATGDLANHPDLGLLGEARAYLSRLENLCKPRTASEGPRLIVIPGNHDTRYWGSYRIGTNAYSTVFKGTDQEGLYRRENVWIYGFDSSLELRTGANGRVDADQLLRFERRRDSFQSQHGLDFERIYKIVAIHHHPLPIKYDDEKARWLTLTNAAEFLGRMLRSRVDLVLHGHEHVRARARYGRDDRRDPRQIPVLSIGSALKTGDEKNCCQLIDIVSEDNDGSGKATVTKVRVAVYEAEGDSYNAESAEEFDVLSTREAARRTFVLEKKRSKYSYGEVSSTTKINSDGDALRVIEYVDLSVESPDIERAKRHPIEIPKTSGYIDMADAREARGDGLHLELKNLKVMKDSAAGTEAGEGMIDFGRQLLKNDRISYQYSWWAINAFALNEREAGFKYTNSRDIEFTHYTIRDPIDALTIIVQFAEDAPVPLNTFQPRVMNMVLSQEDPVAETQLRDKRALRYYESLRIAALRVDRPVVGYSYGIQWKIPNSPPAPTGVGSGQLQTIRNKLVNLAQSGAKTDSAFFRHFLTTVANVLRSALLPSSVEEFETTLMAFDRRTRRMLVVAAAWIGNSPDDFLWCDYSHVTFRYGEGIVAKAFKTNKPRLYVELTEDEERERKTPNFYIQNPDLERHAVLIGFPVQSPEVNSHVYAAIGLGVRDVHSGLWQAMRQGLPLDRQAALILQESINHMCFEMFKGEFIIRKNH
jgi:predicted MPP superfamily phosphohydrolase